MNALAPAAVDSEARARRFALTLASATLAVLGIGLCVIHAILNDPGRAVLDLLGAASALAGLIFTLRGSPRLGAHLVLCGLTALAALTVLSIGGVESASIFWLVLIPQAATLTLGVRPGLTWGGAALAVAAILWAAHASGLIPPAPEIQPIAVLLEFIGVFIASGSLTVGFQYARQRAHTETRRTLDALEQEVAERRIAEQAAHQAAAEAREASLARSRFIASVSHEIRTPLNGILGLTHLLLQEDLDPRHQRDLKLVQSSGQTLLELLNDVLDLGKIEAGGVELESIPCDPRAIVHEIIGLNAGAAHSRGLELRSHISDRVPPAFLGDPTRVRQVLANLVNNAVKFTPDGHVEVRVDWEDALILEIEDTGIGVPSDKLDRIFEPFSQVDASTTRRFGGTGLGLSVCNELVLAMHGTIEVQSELGVGTTFRILLKVPATELADPAKADDEIDDSPITGRVLVVDDHPVNRLIAKRMLEQFGITVEVAASGFEAIERLRDDLPDLVLMDVQMPDLDGYETTREVRALGDAQSQLPIVALTAHAEDSDEQRSLTEGMNGHLGKPINPDQLRETCRRFLSAAT